jgi:hypothetical protein
MKDNCLKKKYGYKKSFKKCNLFEKLLRMRYYLIVPINICKFIFIKTNLKFSHWNKISIREARWQMRKQNFT